MKSLWNKHYRLLSRYLMVLGAALLITSIVPRQLRFPYEFEAGRTWRYETLVAPYDFPILKSEAEMTRDRERIQDNFSPFYERSTRTSTLVKSNVAADFRQGWALYAARRNPAPSAADSLAILSAALDIIDSVYKQGILSPDSLNPYAGFSRTLFELDGQHANKRFKQEYLSLQDLEARLAGLISSRLQGSDRDWLLALLKPRFEPNVLYQEQSSDLALQIELNKLSPYLGKVSKDEKIVGHGEPLSEEGARILQSYQLEFERYAPNHEPLALWLGYFGIAAISLLFYALFLLNFKADVIRNWRSLLFLLLLMTAFIALTVFSEHQQYPTLFLVPYCILPIIIRAFFGNGMALFSHLITLLMASFLVNNSGEFMFLHLVAGMAAIFSNLRAHYWSQFFTAMGFLLLTYIVSWLAISLVQQGRLVFVDPEPFGWLALNVFFCLMAYPLVLVFERLFGMVSDITLRELSDLNKPLLRELSLKAPGTMQHSVQVANLAEAAVAQIGGNTLLTRVGALYHDIGKIKNPVFFIENQVSGDNPHDGLQPEESARMIISHVQNGVEMGRKKGLPDSVIDFIRTHHGSTRVEFFWNRYSKLNPSLVSAGDARFRYPGPLPFSKETAVVMMADSIEAASRVLQQPTVRDIDELVERIIDFKVEDAQLAQSDLTFRELTQIGKVFRKLLLSIHHVRIAYPEGAKAAKEKSTT